MPARDRAKAIPLKIATSNMAANINQNALRVFKAAR
jgi:hypothetical protein